MYREICIEEEYDEELLESLKKECIETINLYLEYLVQKRPKELLELYIQTLLIEIDRASDRKWYQKTLSNFNNLLKIPGGKENLIKIIKNIREHYKNRKALQEELDFYEETYL